MASSRHSDESALPAPCDDASFAILSRIGFALRLPITRIESQKTGAESSLSTNDFIAGLVSSASQAGVLISETQSMTHDEVSSFIGQGYPVVVIFSAEPAAGSTAAPLFREAYLIERMAGRSIEAVRIGEQVRNVALSASELKQLFAAVPNPRKLLCKKELECDSISAVPNHHSNGHQHAHPSPLSRFIALLKLDIRDILTIVLFAFVAGTLSLATPLAVESLVNVVSWGTYLQPLIVLGLMLLVCLGLAGFLGVLQMVIVELIQRRQYVRIVGDLAHRFPRANRAALEGVYPREYANRVFDIMTIQKASAVLLLDGVSIVLTTVIGLVLLAFYHPYLLGFDLVLLISMITITRVLGRGGIRTSVAESATKYRVAHWLQDVLASPGAFKVGGGEALSIQRTNQFTADYLNARQRQFRVVIRQVAFAILLELIASTAVLVIGGWLVIDGQLTLGQLVASELVVTVVVGAFAKAGKSLEKFYDLMAGIDKVGYLIDIEPDPRNEKYVPSDSPAGAGWTDIAFINPASTSKVDAATILPGSRTAIVGNDVNGRSLLVRAIAGLATTTSGRVQVAGLDPIQVLSAAAGKLVGYVGPNDIFHGTLRENVDLGRIGISQQNVRNSLEQVGLSEVILHLHDGLETHLQTAGYPLSDLQSKLVILARAMVGQPKLLVIDGLLDDLPHDERQAIWSHLTAKDAPWTLIVNTNRDDVAALCDDQISIRKS